MIIDSDKLKGTQTVVVLQNAMDELTQAIEQVTESLWESTDRDLDAEDRQGYRETAADALGQLFGEFEALQRICAERLV